MEGAFALITSLGTLVAIGYKSATLICKIIDELGEAATQVQGIATDLKTVCFILRTLKSHIQITPNLSNEAQDVAREIIALCKTNIAGIQKFLEPLNSSSGQNLDRKTKIKWVLSKGKVTSRRASLESLKSTLQLFIHALQFMQSGEMEEHTKDEVEFLIHESEVIKDTLLNAEQADRQPVSSHQQEQSTALPRLEYDVSSAASDNMGMALLSPPEENSLNGNNTIVARIDKKTGAEGSRSVPDSSNSMNDISDDDFVLIAQHIRVQTIVRRFVIWVLYPKEDDNYSAELLEGGFATHINDFNINFDQSYTGTPGSYLDPTEKSRLQLEVQRSKALLLQREAEIIKLQASLDHFHKGEEIGKLREQLQKMQAAAEEKFEKNKQEEFLKETESLVRIKVEAELRAAEEKKRKEEEERQKAEEVIRMRIEKEIVDKLEADKAAASAAAEAAAKAKAEAEKLKKQIEEDLKAKMETAAKHAEQSPIRFKDAVGRKFTFPFHLCATWTGMEELIKQAFLQVDVLGPHVQEGHYDLIGPDGEIILPSVWEKVIQPDWAITMTMWPMDKLPPVGPKMPRVGQVPGGRPPIIPGRGNPPMGSRSPGQGSPGGIPPPPGWNKPQNPTVSAGDMPSGGSKINASPHGARPPGWVNGFLSSRKSVAETDPESGTETSRSAVHDVTDQEDTDKEADEEESSQKKRHRLKRFFSRRSPKNKK